MNELYISLFPKMLLNFAYVCWRNFRILAYVTSGFFLQKILIILVPNTCKLPEVFFIRLFADFFTRVFYKTIPVNTDIYFHFFVKVSNECLGCSNAWELICTCWRIWNVASFHVTFDWCERLLSKIIFFF